MKKLLLSVGLLTGLLAQAKGYESETREVEALVNATSVHSRYNYCIQGTLSCRTLVLLKDKNTGALVPEFYDNFMSSERQVASTGYFLKNRNGTYRAYLDQVFDGKPIIDLKFSENRELLICFDGNHFPTVQNMTLKTLGTTRYLVAEMSYDAEKATLKGTEYDSANPNYSKDVSVTYLRVP